MNIDRSCGSNPPIPIQRPILNCFREMLGTDRLRRRQIRYRPSHFQDPLRSAPRQASQKAGYGSFGAITVPAFSQAPLPKNRLHSSLEYLSPEDLTFSLPLRTYIVIEKLCTTSPAYITTQDKRRTSQCSSVYI